MPRMVTALPAGAQGALLALPHGLEHGFPKILEPEDQLQVHTAGLHDWGWKGDVDSREMVMLTPGKGDVNSWERGC